MPRKGRPKPQMPKGFKKGQVVRIRGTKGLPAGKAEVMGGCFGGGEHISVMIRGAGKAGRPKLGCVRIADVRKV